MEYGRQLLERMMMHAKKPRVQTPREELCSSICKSGTRCKVHQPIAGVHDGTKQVKYSTISTTGAPFHLDPGVHSAHMCIHARLAGRVTRCGGAHAGRRFRHV